MRGPFSLIWSPSQLIAFRQELFGFFLSNLPVGFLLRWLSSAGFLLLLLNEKLLLMPHKLKSQKIIRQRSKKGFHDLATKNTRTNDTLYIRESDNRREEKRTGLRERDGRNLGVCLLSKSYSTHKIYRVLILSEALST